MKFRIAMTVAVVIIGLLGYLAFGQDSSPKKRGGSSQGTTNNYQNFKM